MEHGLPASDSQARVACLLDMRLTALVLMGGQSLRISARVHKNVRVLTYTVISRCRQSIGAPGKSLPLFSAHRPAQLKVPKNGPV